MSGSFECDILASEWLIYVFTGANIYLQWLFSPFDGNNQKKNQIFWWSVENVVMNFWQLISIRFRRCFFTFYLCVVDSAIWPNSNSSAEGILFPKIWIRPSRKVKMETKRKHGRERERSHGRVEWKIIFDTTWHAILRVTPSNQFYWHHSIQNRNHRARDAHFLANCFSFHIRFLLLSLLARTLSMSHMN